MAYRKPEAKKKSYRATKPEAKAEPREPRTREESNREAGRGNAGRYNRGGNGGGGSRGDLEFERLTGLFPGKKEGSFSAFISYDMEKTLRDLRGGDKDHPGDIIGVSEDDEGKLYMWIGRRK